MLRSILVEYRGNPSLHLSVHPSIYIYKCAQSPFMCVHIYVHVHTYMYPYVCTCVFTHPIARAELAKGMNVLHIPAEQLLARIPSFH